MKLVEWVLFGAICLIMGSCSNSEKSEQHKDTGAIQFEKFRPRYHFTPQAKWMNDPNGLVYHNEYYHLFYQYYPDSTVWGPMHWGHARSRDLLNWEHLPIALYPDSLGYIFSGSALIDKNNTAGFGENAMVAIFTYHDPEGDKAGRIDYQTQGIAFSNDDGLSWTKFSGNPVIPNPGIKDFRDPKVFWNEQKQSWQMVLVGGDHVIFYESSDLKTWQKLSEFRYNDTEELGVWECPDLFKLPVEGTDEEKWVLIISHGTGAPNGGSGTRYFVGDYDGTTFSTKQKGSKWIDYGTDNYAGVTYNHTPDGDRIFIGWMSNWAYATTTPTVKWRSAMTLPRTLSLQFSNGAYILKSEVVDHMQQFVKPINSVHGDEVPVLIENDSLCQSRISFDAKFGGDLHLELSNTLGDRFKFGYLQEKESFYIDRSESGSVDFNEKFLDPSPQLMHMDTPGVIKVELFIDASSVEIFLDGGLYVMTTQVFPESCYTRLNLNNPKEVTISEFNASFVETLTHLKAHE